MSLLRLPTASKWRKNECLKEKRFLLPYLPALERYSSSTLREMLHSHRSIFLKPDCGGGGQGVLRITLLWDQGHPYLQIHSAQKRYPIDLEAGLRWIEYYTKDRRYLVQQAIHLIEQQGRPLDFRVLLQRPGIAWRCMGIRVRIAAPGQIVTNFSRGGSVALLKHIVGGDRKKSAFLRHILQRLSLTIAEALTEAYPWIRELGIDIGLDKQGHLWVFEANTKPRFKLFQAMPTPHTYRRILKNHRQILRIPINYSILKISGLDDR